MMNAHAIVRALTLQIITTLQITTAARSQNVCKNSLFVFVDHMILNRDVMFNINPGEMTKHGFRQYFNEFGSDGNIKEKMQPPKETK